MQTPEYDVSLLWDPEVAVWVATSETIPGFVMESGSMDALVERVRFAVPELLELNGISVKGFTRHFSSERYEQVCL